MKSQKAAQKSLKFKHAIEVEVRPLEFQPSAALDYLDVKALSNVASAKIDLGFYKTDCCELHVRAVIKKGIVTNLEKDPCREAKRPSPELAALLQIVRKRIGRRASQWKPLPVEEFFAKAVALRMITVTDGCVTICLLGFCYTCCILRGPNDPGPIKEADLCMGSKEKKA